MHKDMNKDYEPISEQEEEIGKAIVHAAYLVHKELGPSFFRKCMRFAFVIYSKKWDTM